MNENLEMLNETNEPMMAEGPVMENNVNNQTADFNEDINALENAMSEQFPGFLGVEQVEEKEEAKEETEKEENLESIFGSLSSDIEGASSYLSQFMEERTTLTKTGQILNEFKNNIEKEKVEFDTLVEEQRKEINKKRNEIDEYITNQKALL